MYEVDASSLRGLGWRLRVEAHRAVAFEGELTLDDPDGIVVDARCVDAARARGASQRVHAVGARAAARVALRAMGAAARLRATTSSVRTDASDHARHPPCEHCADGPADDPAPMARRVILHVDMDAFFVAVELLRPARAARASR